MKFNNVHEMKDFLIKQDEYEEFTAKDILEMLPSAQLEHDRLNPKIDKNFSSCLDCIHSEDSEYICILRKCVHAIYELRESYTDKRKGEYE